MRLYGRERRVRYKTRVGIQKTLAVTIRLVAVRLFYEFYAQTLLGGKWLCVVVKYTEDDAFVVTAYLTDKPKTGEDLWPVK